MRSGFCSVGVQEDPQATVHTVIAAEKAICDYPCCRMRNSTVCLEQQGPSRVEQADNLGAWRQGKRLTWPN